jgi:hypothetical protein
MHPVATLDLPSPTLPSCKRAGSNYQLLSSLAGEELEVGSDAVTERIRITFQRTIMKEQKNR